MSDVGWDVGLSQMLHVVCEEQQLDSMVFWRFQADRGADKSRGGSFRENQQIVSSSRLLAAKSGRIIWQNNDRIVSSANEKKKNLI